MVINKGDRLSDYPETSTSSFAVEDPLAIEIDEISNESNVDSPSSFLFLGPVGKNQIF